ncbi:hypothetical protein HD806DRAFT_540053 [Xylariaceae sp. AK1471]|nr:hypothetical protein HD806DRAFT_540053 [Xylariaceae sp. AK1471]
MALTLRSHNSVPMYRPKTRWDKMHPSNTASCKIKVVPQKELTKQLFNASRYLAENVDWDATLVELRKFSLHHRLAQKSRLTEPLNYESIVASSEYTSIVSTSLCPKLKSILRERGSEHGQGFV